jgi:hypothetical protein
MSSTTGILRSNVTFTPATTPVVIESRFRAPNVGMNGLMIGGLKNPASTTGFGLLLHPSIPDYFHFDGSPAGYVVGTFTGGNYGTSWTQHTMTFVGAGTGNTSRLRNYADGATPVTYTNTMSYVAAGHPITLGRRYDDANTGQTVSAEWDFILARKRAATEPTLAINNDELQLPAAVQVGNSPASSVSAGVIDGTWVTRSGDMSLMSVTRSNGAELSERNIASTNSDATYQDLTEGGANPISGQQIFVTGATTGGRAADYPAMCASVVSSASPDLIYRVRPTAATTLRFQVNNPAHSFASGAPVVAVYDAVVEHQ